MPPDHRTLRDVTAELVDTPLVPVLFYTEGIKILGVGGSPRLALRMFAFGVVFTLLWAFSDAIRVVVRDDQVDVDVDEDAVVGESDTRDRSADRGRDN